MVKVARDSPVPIATTGIVLATLSRTDTWPGRTPGSGRGARATKSSSVATSNLGQNDSLENRNGARQARVLCLNAIAHRYLATWNGRLAGGQSHTSARPPAAVL